jgi:TolB-like protein
VALLGAGATWTLGLVRNPTTGSYDSIAVLPFSTSGDAEDEYFGDGLAEELINALSGIDGLKVAARTSAFSFKGNNVDIRSETR